MIRRYRFSLSLSVFVFVLALSPAAVMAQTSTVAIIPQVAAGSFDGGVNIYSTAIQVINSETTPVTLNLQFFSADGSISTLNFTTTNASAPTFRGSLPSLVVPSNDSVIVRTASTTQGVVNWGRIQASNTVTIAAIFDVTDARGNAVSRVGVPASKPDGIHLVIPRIRDVNRAIETGFAVVNAGESSAEITARLYAAGQVVAMRSFILGPKRHTAQYFSQLFSLNEAAGFTSWTHVDLSSSSPSLAAMALLLEDNKLTSVPVSFLAAAPSTGGTTTVTPLVLFAAEQVDYGKSGQKLGSFLRTAAGQWEEKNTQGQTNFRFVETSRDANAVYLLDGTRNVSIQINLSTKKIIYSDTATRPFDLYDVLTSSTTPATTPPSTVSAPDASVFYFLQTKLSQLDRKCLEGNQHSPQNTLGGYSFMDNCSLVTGQLWKFVSLESRGYPGYYQLTTYGQQNQGLCLESSAYNKSTNSGTGAYMANCGSQLFTGQMWKLLPAGDGFKLQSKYRESANQCFEGNKVAAGSTLNGAAFMDTCGDLTGQIWTRIPQSQFSSIPDPKIVTPPVDPTLVTGFNVEQVYHGRGGQQTGSFFRTGAAEWKERDARDQPTFTFSEVSRDEWSVYLRDTSRNVTIQIDLHRKKVIYSDANSRFDLYDVQRWASVTGYTGQQAYLGRNGQQVGAFFQTGATAWKEVDSQGRTTATFTETGRDDWSVYMRDASRNVSVQLDFFRKKLRYMDTRTPWTDLYDLLAIASTNGYLAQQSAFGLRSNRFGVFALTAPGQWKETNVEGKTTFTFTETGRDEWSVYLRDASRSVSIQLDLFRKKVVYSDDRSRFDLYDVLRGTVLGSGGAEAATQPQVDLNKLGFVGSTVSYDEPTLRKKLADQGLTLVKSNSLEKNQCALFYKETNLKDIKADGGVLACNTETADGVARVELKAFYGGCDVSEINRGVGSLCQAAVVSDEIRVNAGGGVYTSFTGKFAGVEECTAISAERTCVGVGADLISTSFKVESKNGTGIGLTLAAGVGGRFQGGYDDETGTISFEGCGKALVGACIDLSVNVGDVVEVYRLGESAYLENEAKIVAVGNQITKDVTKAANTAVTAGGQVLTRVQASGQSVVALAEDVGQRTVETVNQARQTAITVTNTVQTGTNQAVTAVASSTNRVISFLGFR